MTTGELYWIELPPTNGHEQGGRRPAIILLDQTVSLRLPVILTIPITTALAALRFPGTLRIDATASNRLSKASVALIFQLRAVDRKRIKEKIGSLDSETLQNIFAKLDELTGRTAKNGRDLPLAS